MNIFGDKKSWRFKEKFIELGISAFCFAVWVPLFAKRSFWEEWGPWVDGKIWMNGGIELVPATFFEALRSPYFNFLNLVLNSGLLLLYSIMGACVLRGLYVLAKRLMKR